MLFCVGWTDRAPVRRQREAFMQLELFHPQPEQQQEYPVWEQLSQEQRSALIVNLVKLMKKTLLPAPKEDHDER
jgi:hypothetical protein